MQNKRQPIHCLLRVVVWSATLLTLLVPFWTSAAPPTVTTVQAVSRAYTESVDLPGTTVMGFETAGLEAKVGGYVKEIGEVTTAAGTTQEIDIGTNVAKGQVLAVLDAPELLDDLAEKKALILQAKSDVAQAEAAILQAKANVASTEAALAEAETEQLEKDALRKLAQAEYENQQKLFDSQATTRELLVKAQSQLDAAVAAIGTTRAHVRTAAALVNAAEANVQRAEADRDRALAGVAVAESSMRRVETMINYTSIRAPFDGVVTNRMVDHGTFVRSATSNSSAVPLFEITRNDKVRLVAKVPMARAQRVRIGQPLVFHSVGGLAGATVAGQISRASAVLDKNSRMLEIHVYVDNPTVDAGYTRQDREWVRREIADPREVTLQPGMFGTATILESWDDLSVVPTTAIGTNETGDTYVLIVENVDGKTVCRRQVVDVVFNDAAEVGVSSGLSTGDSVVARNVARYADGEEVLVGR